jgi:hypothetical protein
LTQAEEEDEPTLLMAMVDEVDDGVKPTPSEVIELLLEQ